MNAMDRAKRVQRVGSAIFVLGGSVGIVAWLFGFKGDLGLPSVYFQWPIGLGGLIALVGLGMEKAARKSSPDAVDEDPQTNIQTLFGNSR